LETILFLSQNRDHTRFTSCIEYNRSIEEAQQAPDSTSSTREGKSRHNKHQTAPEREREQAQQAPALPCAKSFGHFKSTPKGCPIFSPPPPTATKESSRSSREVYQPLVK
jgi:hypothetical protein